MKNGQKKVRYVGGVGIDRLFPLPVCKLRTIIGHKVMLLEARDATELLKDQRLFELMPDDAPVDLDYTNPEETAMYLDAFKQHMEEVAVETEQSMLEAKEERKVKNSERKISESSDVSAE